jgi:hypothetical protein
MPVDGGEEQRVTHRYTNSTGAIFAVTDAGIYLLDSDTAPKPTIMFYSFQTRLAYTGAPARVPCPMSGDLAASRDGRTVFFAEGNRHSSITMAENFQ